MITRVIVCTILGAACGALAGGLMVAFSFWATAPAGGSGLLGSRLQLARLGLALGLTFGGLPGVVIGLAVAFARSRPLPGALAGLAVGVLVSLILLVVLDAASDAMGRVLLVLSPPVCALVGSAVSNLAVRLLR